MLTIRHLNGQEEGFVSYQGLVRKRRVNGEKTINFTAYPTVRDEKSFNLIEEESTVIFDDEEYIIKKLSERSIGKVTVKRVEAIHKFFVDLIGKQQPTIHNGSITFRNYMNLVFENTGYTFTEIDQFYARSFENLGNDNRLALLSKGLERYKAEMELVGTQVRLKHQVGIDSDFQFRYNHNIKSIEKDVDTTNLATVIRGKGDPELGVEAYYRSDNADYFGEIDAPMVDDERFKSEEALLDEMVSRLEDVPRFSVKLNFVDLRAAGYPYTVPNEGDRVFVIYEPMNDLVLETRILEIEETYGKDDKVVKTIVTLANHKKTLAGSMFENVDKRLSDIIDDDGIVRYNVLDEAVKIATEALKSAQTELIFENGIIARDKDNPNRVVIFNSNGFGLSDDGGQTVREAITADGFVLTAGAIGKLSANHIQIGPETDFKEGYDPTKIKINLDEFEDYVNEAFRDGVIQEAEAKAIEKYLNSLETEKDSLTAQVNQALESDYLESIFELIFESVFENDYMTSYNNLIQSINNAIADGKTTPAEKADVDAKFADYRDKAAAVLNVLGVAAEYNTSNRVDEADTELRENLRLTAPLPTSISMDNYGITASTSTPSRYARLDYRGLYIAGGAIQIDNGLPDSQIANSETWNTQGTYINHEGIYTGQISATQVTLGFNNISNSVKITPGGLETYSGAYRTSLLDGTGHRFYRDEKYIGRIGTAGLHSFPDLRGLNFQLSDEAHYMSWSHLKNANDPYYTIMFAWYKNRQADTEKGFVFSDNITLRSDNVLYARTLSTTNYSTGNRHIQLQNYTWNGYDGVKIRRSDGGAGLFLTNARATLKSDGNAYLEVTQDSTGNRIESIDIRNRHYTSTTNLVRVTENGVLGMSTSSRRYKLLEEPIPLEYAKKILDLEPKTWYDKQTAEDYALELTEGGDFENLPIKRLPGVIAEDLHDLGLGTFVEYDEDKKPNGINHMLWVLLLPIVKKQQAEIDELKSLMGVS